MPGTTCRRLVVAPGKKTAEIIHHETQREVAALLEVVFGDLLRSVRFDLEAIEMATRAAAHQLGATVLQRLLSTPATFDRVIACACGGQAVFQQIRPKQLLTALGPITMNRPYYLCRKCHQGRSPRDAELEGTEYSPGVRRMMATVGSDSSFQHGREELELLAGLTVTTKAVERQAEAIGGDIVHREQARSAAALQLELPEVLGPSVPVMYIEMDGTQIPMVRAELEGRAGRTEGQPARTREVKLGCVFTQLAADRKGRPVRDAGSTTYTGAIETADEFGHRIYTEAWERGWSRAGKKVVLADGAEWIWNIAGQAFPRSCRAGGYLSRAAASVGSRASALRHQLDSTKALDEAATAETGRRADRKTRTLPALYTPIQ